MDEATSYALAKETEEIRKIIREKCRNLKRKREDREEYLKEKYKPLIKPLQSFVGDSFREQVVTHLSTNPSNIKKEEETLIHSPNLPLSPQKLSPTTEVSLTIGARPKFESSTPLPTPASRHRPNVLDIFPSSSTYESSSPLEEISEHASTPQGVETVFSYLDQIGKEANKYILKFTTNQTQDLDQVYGICYNGENFTLGDTVISIKDDWLDVDGSLFKITPGLSQLLFLEDPDMDRVDENDKKNYKIILTKTNAHRMNYSSTGSVNVQKGSKKYRKVIAKLFPLKDKIKGKGYDKDQDPNQLVEKLRFLLQTHGPEKEILKVEKSLRMMGIIL